MHDVFEIFWTIVIIYFLGSLFGIWHFAIEVFERLVNVLKGNPRREAALQVEIRRLERQQEVLTQKLTEERERNRLVIEGKPGKKSDSPEWGSPK